MTLREQVIAQALLLTGELEEKQAELLGSLCTASTVNLTARLREGLTPDDCKADFVAAASLYALSAMYAAQNTGQIQELKAGDLTVKHSDRETAARSLQSQADMLIAPYLKDRFAFLGV